MLFRSNQRATRRVQIGFGILHPATHHERRRWFHAFPMRPLKPDVHKYRMINGLHANNPLWLSIRRKIIRAAPRRLLTRTWNKSRELSSCESLTPTIVTGFGTVSTEPWSVDIAALITVLSSHFHSCQSLSRPVKIVGRTPRGNCDDVERSAIS